MSATSFKWLLLGQYLAQIVNIKSTSTSVNIKDCQHSPCKQDQLQADCKQVASASRSPIQAAAYMHNVLIPEAKFSGTRRIASAGPSCLLIGCKRWFLRCSKWTRKLVFHKTILSWWDSYFVLARSLLTYTSWLLPPHCKSLNNVVPSHLSHDCFWVQDAQLRPLRFDALTMFIMAGHPLVTSVGLTVYFRAGGSPDLDSSGRFIRLGGDHLLLLNSGPEGVLANVDSTPWPP